MLIFHADQSADSLNMVNKCANVLLEQIWSKIELEEDKAASFDLTSYKINMFLIPCIFMAITFDFTTFSLRLFEGYILLYSLTVLHGFHLFLYFKYPKANHKLALKYNDGQSSALPIPTDSIPKDLCNNQ